MVQAHEANFHRENTMVSWHAPKHEATGLKPGGLFHQKNATAPSKMSIFEEAIIGVQTLANEAEEAEGKRQVGQHAVTGRSSQA